MFGQIYKFIFFYDKKVKSKFIPKIFKNLTPQKNYYVAPHVFALNLAGIFQFGSNLNESLLCPFVWGVLHIWRYSPCGEIPNLPPFAIRRYPDQSILPRMLFIVATIQASVVTAIDIRTSLWATGGLEKNLGDRWFKTNSVQRPPRGTAATCTPKTKKMLQKT